MGDEPIKIPAYVIGDRIGAGGFGEVYRARHTLMERDVAIKVLHAKYSEDPDAIARFIAEARAVARISHANIVDVFDFGQLADGRHYCVMELIHGKTLRQLLRERTCLPLEESLPMLRGIAEAVDAVHRAGIAHRDLKPDNVFVTDGGGIKLIDFGLAKLTSPGETPLTETGSIFGTPIYMSPEQCRGKAVDLRTDCYSFGVVAYHVLTGKPPFTGDPLEVALHHLNDLPETPSSRSSALSARVDRVLLALLAKDPAARPTPLTTAIDALTDGAPLTASRSRGAVVWLVGATALVVGSVIAVRCMTTTAVTADTVRLDVTSRNVGNSDSAWLAPIIERMARSRLRGVPDRRFWIDPTASEHVELAVRVAGASVHIEARGADGPLASSDARSVDEALDQLVPIVARRIGEGRLPAGPDPQEQAEMVRLGARSFDVYRRYIAALDEYYRTYYADNDPIAIELEGVIAADPTWAHPYALLATVFGASTPRAREVITRGLRLADPTRDRLGMRMIEAYEPFNRGDHPAATKMLEPLIAADPDDVLLAAMVRRLLAASARFDDDVAMLRHLHESRPDLQFGGDLAQALERAGRSEEAIRTIRTWATLAPESAQAMVESIRIEATARNGSEVERQAGRLVLVHGERPELLIVLCDSYIAAHKLELARRVVDKMLVSTSLTRARGRFRLGMLEVLDGRFASAFDTLERAANETRPFGYESELIQVLVQERAIARIAGQGHDEREKTKALAEAFATYGYGGQAAMYRFAVALIDRGSTCPNVESFLSDLDGQTRNTARRWLLRLAAEADCDTCKTVVAAGMSSDDASTESLLSFARCAIRENQLSLARNSLERASQWHPSDEVHYSGYHSMLALYHLARVEALLGNRASARTYYTSFLERWRSSDRPVPEVADAIKALRALEAP